jgi:hypothetical protein
MSREKEKQQKVKLTKKEKGRRIFEKGGIKKVNDNLYKVPSETRPGKYHEVIPYLNVCSCENFEREAEPCKHCFAVQFEREAEIQKIISERVNKAISKIAVVIPESEFTP